MSVFFSDEQVMPVDGDSLRRFADVVIGAEGYPPNTELSVLLVDETQMSEYNQHHMGRSGATDVLAFPLEDLVPGTPPKWLPGDPPVALGDVFLCPPEVERRARADHIPFDDFLHLLLAHGILHLMGYDHESDEDADRMERREDELLGSIGRSVS
jgi:probable rRNA maturation factor